jgi:hypothetical protein
MRHQPNWPLYRGKRTKFGAAPPQRYSPTIFNLKYVPESSIESDARNEQGKQPKISMNSFTLAAMGVPLHATSKYSDVSAAKKGRDRSVHHNGAVVIASETFFVLGEPQVALLGRFKCGGELALP